MLMLIYEWSSQTIPVIEHEQSNAVYSFTKLNKEMSGKMLIVFFASGNSKRG